MGFPQRGWHDVWIVQGCKCRIGESIPCIQNGLCQLFRLFSCRRCHQRYRESVVYQPDGVAITALHAMRIDDVTNPKSKRVASRLTNAELLEIDGGFNHSMSTYSRRSELTAGIKRNGSGGITVILNSPGKSASFNVYLRLLFARNSLTARSRANKPGCSANSLGGC